MRLNIYLQKAGIGSRREAERMVADGRIAINGVKAGATTPVNDGDAVTLDGKSVAPEHGPRRASSFSTSRSARWSPTAIRKEGSPSTTCPR